MDLTQPILVTQEGLEKLKRELEQTRAGRSAATDRLREAFQPGDIEDNPEAEQAKEDLNRIDDRIYELEEMIGRAQLISQTSGSVAAPGSTLEVVDEDGETVKYHLVGGIEADPAEGHISVESPVGRALLGAKKGDKITVETPAGEIQLTVKAVR
ncbi:MAG: transcription elongation factor GreA [Candidatus Dormibacteraeota bacterium]|nr:transcription elongation factor GreA [Candidatus Dormibacteraeota bacterium]MBO0744458.1 transcription elongation factor GreA [Candidatus Dormibacteraeota bacterium]